MNARHFLTGLDARFRNQKELSERAVAQVGDDAFFAVLGPEDNSIALLVKHVGGNLRSRFTDFLTTDGEKPDRQRDREFELYDGDTRSALMAGWEEGWSRLFATLQSLSPEDLDRTVTIRGEAHSVIDALHRALAHLSYHAGQIVLLAKVRAGAEWQTLSIPRRPRQEGSQ
jgi:hypothetical protein